MIFRLRCDQTNKIGLLEGNIYTVVITNYLLYPDFGHSRLESKCFFCEKNQVAKDKNSASENSLLGLENNECCVNFSSKKEFVFLRKPSTDSTLSKFYFENPPCFCQKT